MRLSPVQISRIFLPLPGLDTIKAEAVSQGFRFVDRLISDWESGPNTFNQEGEVLLGAHDGCQLVAVGGLNQDPYVKGAAVGRIRHLYVLTGWRRQGVGRSVVDSLLREARGTFSEVRLRTDMAVAANFYDRCGFDRVEDETASHRWTSARSAQQWDLGDIVKLIEQSKT
jgi:GNAT superfamily N-acetyltransferase